MRLQHDTDKLVTQAARTGYAMAMHDAYKACSWRWQIPVLGALFASTDLLRLVDKVSTRIASVEDIT